MTIVLLEKGLVLEGLTPKIEDTQVTGIYTLEVQNQTKWLVVRMIHVKDSRSYQQTKFGLWTFWVYMYIYIYLKQIQKV